MCTYCLTKSNEVAPWQTRVHTSVFAFAGPLPLLALVVLRLLLALVVLLLLPLAHAVVARVLFVDIVLVPHAPCLVVL